MRTSVGIWRYTAVVARVHIHRCRDSPPLRAVRAARQDATYTVQRVACGVQHAVAVQQRRAKEEKKAAEMQEQIEKMKVSRPTARTDGLS